jgi:hypothetical protein
VSGFATVFVAAAMSCETTFILPYLSL